MLEGVWSVLVVWRETGRGVGRCVRGQGRREACFVGLYGVRERRWEKGWLESVCGGYVRVVGAVGSVYVRGRSVGW